jgi:chromosome segregation ATPase
MRLRTAALLACIALSALRPRPAIAQSPNEGRLREALRAATAQVSTLEDEKAKLQASEAALQKEIAALRQQAQAAKGTLSRGDGRRVAELNQKLAEQEQAAGQIKESLVRCEAAGMNAAETTRSIDSERGRLTAEVAKTYERLVASEARNAKLYQVGKEIIDWLSSVGVAGAIAAREPVLGLMRVQLENTAQDYEDKLLEHKAKP